MQKVDESYSNIRRSGEYWYDVRVIVENSGSGRSTLIYDATRIMSLKTQGSLFGDSTPSVGNCVSGELSLQLLNWEHDIDGYEASIPKAAAIYVYLRIRNSTQVQNNFFLVGKYFIDTRSVTQNEDGLNILTIHAYDAMLKAEMDYPSTYNQSYPMLDTAMVGVIAAAMGVQVDERNASLMTEQYRFPLPVGYSCREVLSRIASAYGGNFIITNEGKLRLVIINQIPPETRYLIDDFGEAIVFGGDRINV